LIEMLGSDLFIWHSLTELHLEGRWVKATPAFNTSLCRRFGVRPLEFDGQHDSLFQEYDQGGRRYMEYVAQRGHYPDVPYDTIIADFKSTYPRWLAHHRFSSFRRPARPSSAVRTKSVAS